MHIQTFGADSDPSVSIQSRRSAIRIALFAFALSMLGAMAAANHSRAQISVPGLGQFIFYTGVGATTVVLGGDLTFLITDLHYGSRGLPTGLAITEFSWGAVHLASFALMGMIFQETSFSEEGKIVGSIAFSTLGAIGIAEIIHALWSLGRPAAPPDLALNEEELEVAGLQNLSLDLAPTEGGGRLMLSGAF